AGAPLEGWLLDCRDAKIWNGPERGHLGGEAEWKRDALPHRRCGSGPVASVLSGWNACGVLLDAIGREEPDLRDPGRWQRPAAIADAGPRRLLPALLPGRDALGGRRRTRFVLSDRSREARREVDDPPHYGCRGAAPQYDQLVVEGRPLARGRPRRPGISAHRPVRSVGRDRRTPPADRFRM